MTIGNNMHQSPADTPPPYDSAPNQQQFYSNGKAAIQPDSGAAAAADNKPPAGPLNPPRNPPFMVAGPAYIPQSGICSPEVYHYINPLTGEHVTSLLPPDHPEMICLQQGAHVTETKFGLLGVLAAIFWFPLGVGLCLLDRRIRCRRCGTILDSGLCGPS